MPVQKITSLLLVIISILLSSCQDTTLPGEKERVWLDSLQQDSGTNRVKAIWLEDQRDEPWITFEYNGDNQLVKITNPENKSRTEYSYYEDGRLKEIRDFESNGDERIRPISYDDENNIISSYDAKVADNGSHDIDLFLNIIPDEMGVETLEIIIDNVVDTRKVYTYNDDNSITEIEVWRRDAGGELILMDNTSYDHDQNINPLFQASFPGPFREEYQSGLYNIKSKTSNSGVATTYFYEYKADGRPYKRKQLGEKYWIFQYY